MIEIWTTNFWEGKLLRGTKMRWLKQTVFVVNWERRRKDEVTGSRLGRFHCSCRIRSWLRCRREDSKWYILLTLRAVLFWPCFIYFIDGVCVSLFFLVKTKGGRLIRPYIFNMFKLCMSLSLMLSPFCLSSVISGFLKHMISTVQLENWGIKCNEIEKSWIFSWCTKSEDLEPYVLHVEKKITNQAEMVLDDTAVW